MNKAVAAALAILLMVLVLPMTAPRAAAAGPTISILAPQNDEVIGSGSPVIVRFEVSNFTLVQPGRVGQISPPSEGHVDVYVDGTFSRLVARVEPQSFVLPSGPHTIRLQLVANNGTPLTPDVSASVRIVSTGGPAAGQPTIRIVSPTPGQVTGHDVYIVVEVGDFLLVDSRGQPNAPNEGHMQLLLNDAFQQEPRAYEHGFMVDLPDGKNTITARLVNNDGTPLSPVVSTSVTISVKGASDPTPGALVTGGISAILAAILTVLVLRRRKAAAVFARNKD